MSNSGNPKREESDSMGSLLIDEAALYGASTQRAIDNFPISGFRMPIAFIHNLAKVKRACAQANQALGVLDETKARLICEAAEEICQGKHDQQFPVDVFQTGSGTSTNMNINEVIANLCSRKTGNAIGSKQPIHPNDHVNRSQSSNDIIPTAMHMTVALAIRDGLQPAMQELESALRNKSDEFRDIIKVGRTHTMDAVPVRLGQVFGGYARQMEKGRHRLEKAIASLQELAIGGTAVGSGLNAPIGFGKNVCDRLSRETGMDFKEAQDHFEGQGARDDLVEVAGTLSTVAASLGKIASDIRLLASGPRAGIGEIKIPPVQPGSSIMPGKVNPVMCEMLVQVSHYVSGLCHTIQRSGQDGQFELNATLPLMAYCFHSATDCLSNGIRVFAEKCVSGLEADEKRCRSLLAESLMLVTALNPKIGYEKSVEVAKLAHEENLTLLQAVARLGYLKEEDAEKCLDPKSMVGS